VNGRSLPFVLVLNTTMIIVRRRVSVRIIMVDKLIKCIRGVSGEVVIKVSIEKGGWLNKINIMLIAILISGNVILRGWFGCVERKYPNMTKVPLMKMIKRIKAGHGDIRSLKRSVSVNDMRKRIIPSIMGLEVDGVARFMVKKNSRRDFIIDG